MRDAYMNGIHQMITNQSLNLNVGIVTGDVTLNKNAFCLVMTKEIL